MYSGPEYFIHFKYASILTQVFVSFMYGIFLPILIPITCFGIFNLYVVERYSLAYYARQPPHYDEKLNKRVLELLRFAPIFMLSFGYWALGNRQMFFGEVPPIEFASDNIDPGHHLFDFEH